MTSDSETALSLRIGRGGRRLATLAVLVALLTPARAGAEEGPDAETRTIARELAVQGAEALDAKDYATALDRFQRASALVRAPSLTVMQARTLVALGRFVEALDKYEETQRMPLPPNAAEALRAAVRDAAREANELRARLPWLRLSLAPSTARASELEVFLDGKAVRRATLDVERPIDPGQHELEVRSGAQVLERRSVALSEGEHRALELGPVSAAPRADASMPKAAWSRRDTGYVALGVGAVGVTASIVTGVMALNQRSDLNDVCHPGCPESESDKLASYRLDRTLSYVGLGVGLVGAGVGGYLLLSSAPSSQLALGTNGSSAWLRGNF